MSLDKRYSLDKSAAVVVSDLSSAAETATIGAPVWIPNPALDGGSIEKKGVLVAVADLQPAGASGIFTADPVTDILTTQTAIVADGDIVRVSSDSLLPTPLSESKVYFARDVSGASFKVALNRGGAAIDLIDPGDGNTTVEIAPEGGIVCGQVIEDPARNRLLMLAHTNIALASGVGASAGRRVHLYSMPWGHPEATPTRLTTFDSPLIELDDAGGFDSGNCFQPTGCILGKYLYIAYTGSTGGTPGDQRVGLAMADISVASPVATKMGQLQVGNSPYAGGGCTLDYIDGKFYLWVNSADVAGACPQVSRLWTASRWRSTATAGDWTQHRVLKTYGAYETTVGNNLPWVKYHLGENRWIQAQISGGTSEYIHLRITDMANDEILEVDLGDIITSGGAPADAFDASRMFYHAGKWYFTFMDGSASDGYEVSLGEYAFDTPYTPANAPAETKYLRTQPLTRTSSQHDGAGGYAEVDFSDVYKYLDSVAQQTGSAGTTRYINALNQDKNGNTYSGKMRVKAYNPTNAHTHPHGDPTTGSNTPGLGSGVDTSVTIINNVWVVTGRPI